MTRPFIERKLIEIGRRYGQLRVVGTKFAIKTAYYYPCVCDCGLMANRPASYLNYSTIRACDECTAFINVNTESPSRIDLSKLSRDQMELMRLMIDERRCGPDTKLREVMIEAYHEALRTVNVADALVWYAPGKMRMEVQYDYTYSAYD